MEHSVRDICGVLGITRSRLYYHPKLDPSEEELRTRIEQVAATYPTYGYRRITKVLAAEGHPVGYKRVSRLMKAANLSVTVKRACQTTHSADGPHPWQNRLKTLDMTRVDPVWVGDIPYVRLKGRFVSVAVLMDVFTRMIRGWNLSQHLNPSLTLKPLEQALHNRVPEIHHADQGAQYLSKDSVSTLRQHGVEISVAHRGCPWENGYAERLIRTLKEEEVHLNDYQNIHEARERIEQFLTQVYHLKRPHAALGYLTPLEFERKNLDKIY